MSATAEVRLNPARVRSMIVPREHGAWGMLFMPMATGAVIALAQGGRVSPILLFAVAALALFWLRTPVESLLGTTPFRPQTAAERQPVLIAAVFFAAVAIITLTVLFWGGNQRQLLVIGGVAALAFVAQAALKKLGRSTRMLSQMVGVIGLTATAPAAYYVSSGRFDERAWAIWLANWFFAAGQVHFVQLRIHTARAAGLSEKLRAGRWFLAAQVLMIVGLALAWKLGVLPALAIVAFIPVTVRGLRWFFRRPQPLAVRTLGWWEVAHSLTFGTLLVLAFLLSHPPLQ